MSPQAQHHSLLGLQHFSRGNWGAARDQFLEAIRLDPSCPDYQFNAAMALWSNGQIDEAGPYLQSAIRLKPSLGTAHAWLGEWFKTQGQIDDALAATATALKLEPNNPAFLQSRARVLAASDPDAAWGIVRELLPRTVMTPSLACLYGMLAPRFGQQAEALGAIEKLIGSQASFADAPLQFAAADLLDRAGRYDEAFARATSANAATRGEPYDASIYEQLADRLIEYFTPERLRSLPKSTLSTSKPIFIVGMPRSGTSLVEQIVASHPAVHGAGELKFMHQVWHRLLQALQANFDEYPFCLDKLTAAQANDLSQSYLGPLAALSPGAGHITDKMPLNFLHLGLIALLFPQAKIIHCAREPLDTCLSCFFTQFSYPHPFKQSLETLGHFYRQYERLMRHWKRVLTIPMLEVPYERLIETPEATTRQLLDFLSLPWDDRCLAFHKTARPCSTASIMQVRQPIYKTSVGRWRNYEKHLGPLKAALASNAT